jgi:1-deoxy-D-xylulose-5-phosphate reductoisomerase
MQPLPHIEILPKAVTVLGSTGSIGRNTVDLLTTYRDRFSVQALTAHRNVALLAQQAKDLGAKRAVIAEEGLYQDLKTALSGSNIEAAAGTSAVVEAAQMPSDWTMASIVGTAGMAPTLAAIQRGKTVALANKESLVAAGSIMMNAVRKSGTTLLPVDSEHNAIFQVLNPAQREALTRIILTASGGPFLKKKRSELADITPAEAVRHPNWSMGAKVSVDSATMMNKALEIIEASYLFDLKSEKIDVVIHPQSIIHSMVEYDDGSILAQMGAPDMRTPILHTLAWPGRLETTGNRLNLNNNININFEPVDTKRFIAMKLVRDVLQAGAGMAIAFNAANEVAVEAFLGGNIKFTEIENVTEDILQRTATSAISSLEGVMQADLQARKLAAEAVTGLQ